MRSRCLVSTWVSACLVLAACGDDGAVPVDAGRAIDGGPAPRFDAGRPMGGTVPETEHARVVAQAWCDLQFECGCAELDVDVLACVSRITAHIERNAERWRAMGLTYDDRCAASVLNQIAVRGCSGFSRSVEVGCEACPFYHGDQPRGEACDPISASAATTCSRGLLCVSPEGAGATCEDTCEAFPRVVGAGEACDGDGNVLCDPQNTACGSSGTCEAFPTVGEPCPLGRCSGEAYCDRSTDTCVPFLERGESCTGPECDTAFCDEGVCASFCWPQPF